MEDDVDVNRDDIFVRRIHNDILLYVGHEVIAQLVTEQQGHDDDGDKSHCNEKAQEGHMDTVGR